MKRAIVFESNGDDAELHTVLAALRYYQSHGLGNPDKRPDWIHEIATNCDNVSSSCDSNAIDIICERINISDNHLIEITVQGGNIQDVVGVIPGISVIIVDYDNDGGQGPSIAEWEYEDVEQQ